MYGGGCCIKSEQLTIAILGAEQWPNSLEHYLEMGRVDWGRRMAFRDCQLTPLNVASVLHAT